MGRRSNKNKNAANTPPATTETTAPVAPPATLVAAAAPVTPAAPEAAVAAGTATEAPTAPVVTEETAQASTPAATVPAETPDPLAPLKDAIFGSALAAIVPATAPVAPPATPDVTAMPPVSPEAKDEEGETSTPGDNGLRPPPPWPNFNAPPEDHNAKALREALAQKAAQEKAELVLAKGFSRYVCLRDNGSGAYRKGKIYPLPDGQHPDLFRKV